MKSFTVWFATILLMAAPVAVLASGTHQAAHGAGDIGMSVEGKMIMLGIEEIDGVKAFAHLNDVRKQMADHGQDLTHHLMVAFEDGASGEAIESGTVAVKVEDPEEQVSEPIRLTGMDGHFGVDLKLDKPGIYHFKIGPKLPDGKARTFHLYFENN